MSISNTPNTPANPFVELILQAALIIIPELRPGEIYTAAQILAAVWGQLDKAEHIRAGRVIFILAKTGQIPLVEDWPTSANWKRYRLR